MDLFERVKLLVRSTLSGGLPEFSSGGGDPQKMLDKAESKLEILRDDLARAEKKGNDELAGKLKSEIASLERMIAKARGKAQSAGATPVSAPVAPASISSAAPEPAKAETPIAAAKPAGAPQEAQQEAAKPADVVIDESRVADQLKKLREGK